MLQIRDTLDPKQFMFLHYEEMALNPDKTAKDVYEFIDHPINKKVENWIENSKTPSNTKKKFLSTVVNSTYVVDKWKTLLKLNRIKAVEKACAKTIELGGYEKF